jgi:deoxyribodipyrimidine photo-lyase
MPQTKGTHGFPGDEAAARRKLVDFLAGPIHNYAIDRNRLDLDGTSALSAVFRFGLLSAREAANMLSSDADPGPAAWLNELIWRDFYLSVLFHFPEVVRSPFKESFCEFGWRRDSRALACWQEGRTGYPVVDAAMRQLQATGWMHNRGRMIVASFLVKDLRLDWREGEIWFMRQLVDGDPAANNGGWQWAAGTGTDAAPFFRIFNPVTQGRRFDPEGNYVRRWVPELAGLPARYIHCPWEAPHEHLRAAGVRLGRNYPHRIVDHGSARLRALAVFNRAKR